jgi:hypothetical protein
MFCLGLFNVILNQVTAEEWITLLLLCSCFDSKGSLHYF